jgi:hypothetical protein
VVSDIASVIDNVECPSAQPVVMAAVLATAMLFAMAARLAQAAEPISDTDTSTIEKITGMKGKPSRDENVLKVARPRTDVKRTSHF